MGPDMGLIKYGVLSVKLKTEGVYDSMWVKPKHNTDTAM